MEIELEGIKLFVDTLLFDLEGIDVVLGMSWLATLGEMVVDWGKQTMRFQHNKEWVMVQGQSTKHTAQIALQSFVGNTRKWVEEWFFASELVPQNRVAQTTEMTSLTPIQKQQLDYLLEQFAEIFTTPVGLPPRRQIEHRINLLEGQGPVNVRPYRYSHHHKDEIEKQTKELLQAGLVRHSQSAFSSPVILVKKKDGSWRMCVDYRALNKATVLDKFPIPVIDELLDELHGAMYFSKLDLRSGYHQVLVRGEDVHKTAFRTHEGHYEYLVMPFGLMNAPSTFQSLMNEVFRAMLRRFVLVFFDDILVYSHDWPSHLQHLSTVLRILRDQKLVVNRKKCAFAQCSIEYLGHVVSQQGVTMDPAKIASIINWPTPKNVKGVRGFLGLTGYYRKFVKDYGRIARPLTELTKKDGFTWNPRSQLAFDTLKIKMTTAPVLALPDFSQPFIIESDASGCGVGAILMQNSRPVAFFSKALSERNQTKSAYEKELMAIVLAVQHWRPYLLGRQFIVYTDQKSLRQLLHQRISTMDQQNWAAKLLGYQFDIVYKPGATNGGADALSRMYETGELHSLISYPVWSDGGQLMEEVHQDEALATIIAALKANTTSKPGFSYREGVLYYEGRLVISAQSMWIPKLFHEFHATPQGGHSGFYRTYRKLAANIYWIGMKRAVQEYVRSCDVCQRQKYLATTPGGLLQPLPIPEKIWDDLSMDFINGLPKVKGIDSVFVVVDRLSKYAHFIPLKHPYTARVVAEHFTKEVVRLHGTPKSIVSDRDPIFVSNFWKELFKLQGTHLTMSTAYHPETDGQTEVVNRCLETYLRCFIADQPRTWIQWVHWAEYWYNTTFHESIGVTPFEIVYGRKPPTLLRFAVGETKVEAVQQELLDRDEALRQLKGHLLRAQVRMKAQADKKRHDQKFEVGDWVFVKLRPHRQQSVAHRINPKLSARFYGPFQVLECIGSVAYKLQLPDSSRIHPVFHVSLLKKAVGTCQVEKDLPESLSGEIVETAEPELVLASRTESRQDDEVKQCLIKWQGKSKDEATWEDELTILNQFPAFNLEDKVVSQEGGIDRTQNDSWAQKNVQADPGLHRPRIWRVYTRRNRIEKANRA